MIGCKEKKETEMAPAAEAIFSNQLKNGKINVKTIFYKEDGSISGEFDEEVFKEQFSKPWKTSVVSKKNYTLDGNPDDREKGFFEERVMTVKSGESSTESKISFFNKEGHPCPNPQLQGAWAMTVTTDDNKITLSYFGEKGEAILIPFLGVYKIVMLKRMNGKSRMVATVDKYSGWPSITEQMKEVSYYDEQGKLMLNKFGVAREVFQNKEDGVSREVTFLGVDGESVRFRNRCNKALDCVDEEGDMKYAEFYDEKGDSLDIQFEDMSFSRIEADGDNVLLKNSKGQTVKKMNIKEYREFYFRFIS